MPRGVSINVVTCPECHGSRAVPDLFGDLEAFTTCVIDAGATFVVFEEDQAGAT